MSRCMYNFAKLTEQFGSIYCIASDLSQNLHDQTVPKNNHSISRRILLTGTIMAFKNHQVHDSLVEPGTADLTADVDFSFLREIMKNKMLVYGPVEQGDFLLRMGIKARMDMLLERLSTDSAKDQIKSGYDMIVDKSKMGERYKCMAVFPQVLDSHLKKYPVAGFFEDNTDN